MSANTLYDELVAYYRGCIRNRKPLAVVIYLNPEDLSVCRDAMRQWDVEYATICISHPENYFYGIPLIPHHSICRGKFLPITLQEPPFEGVKKRGKKSQS